MCVSIYSDWAAYMYFSAYSLLALIVHGEAGSPYSVIPTLHLVVYSVTRQEHSPPMENPKATPDPVPAQNQRSQPLVFARRRFRSEACVGHVLECSECPLCLWFVVGTEVAVAIAERNHKCTSLGANAE